MLAALREHGLLERSLICSTYAESLRVLRAAAPEVRLGFSYPALRSDPTTRPGTKYAALALAAGARQMIPAAFARRIRRGEFDAVMIHWRLFSPRLLRAVRAAGGEVYVWTVDDPVLVESLVELGVDGVITNDPRLFGGADGGQVPQDPKVVMPPEAGPPLAKPRDLVPGHAPS